MSRKELVNQATVTGQIDIREFAQFAVESGMFPDLQGLGTAVLKIQAGAELGLGPMASLAGVWISREGTPNFHANMMAAIINSSETHRYEVMELSDRKCTLNLYRNETLITPEGCSFSIADAQRAGLMGKDSRYNPWAKYPRNMLFARCISNLAKWYCPELFSGITPYVPEELGTTVNKDGNPVRDDPRTGNLENGKDEDERQQPFPRHSDPEQGRKKWRKAVENRPMTKAQANLIRKLSRSAVFSQEEKEKAEAFAGNPDAKSQAASQFIDSLKAHIEERKNVTCVQCNTSAPTYDKNELITAGWHVSNAAGAGRIWQCPGCREAYLRSLPLPDESPSELLEKAEAIRQTARRAEGQTYSDEMAEAAKLEQAADLKHELALIEMRNASSDEGSITDEQSQTIRRSLSYFNFEQGSDQEEDFILFVEEYTGKSRETEAFALELIPNFSEIIAAWEERNAQAA